jgi:glycosyltransferase involved in cell wall biosynthesis
MNQSKKIISFIHIKYPYGGGEKVTTDVCRYLIDHGYFVYIFVAELDESKIGADHNGINFLILPNSNLNSIENSQFIPQKIKELEISYFVIPDFQLKCIKTIKLQSYCKIIYQLHNVPLWEMIFKVAAGENNARKSIGKYIEWNLLRKWKYKFLKLHKTKILKYYKETYDAVDAYVVLCDSYGRDIANIVGVDYMQSKIHTLTNPTNFIEPKQIINKKKQILYVGRLLYAQKRVDRLIAIWGKIYDEFRDWELLIVGEGPEKQTLETQVSNLHIERVRFCGFSNTVSEYYNTASILCLTSTYEGWPLALVEAQANGIVPISFNCCAGVEEILSPDYQNGVLVTAFELDEYADKLKDLMQNKDLRNQIVKNNYQRVQKYDLNLIGLRWEELLNAL